MLKTAVQIVLILFSTWTSAGQVSNSFLVPEKTTNREVVVNLSAAAGSEWRIQRSDDLLHWENWLTFLGSDSIFSQPDSAAPFARQRFYRAYSLAQTNFLVGDHLSTTNGDLVIHPISHAGFVLNWNGQWIYSDPVASPSVLEGIPKATFIVITHSHFDHFDAATLENVRGPDTRIFAPRAVYNLMRTTVKPITTVLTNGETASLAGGIRLDAIPMYNTSPDRLNRHPPGFGNGYILTLGGRRIYISGDTEDTPEMLALREIDVAFLCMSLPSNMTVEQAAGAVRMFRPRIVYPYHFRGTDPAGFGDPARFKELVGLDLGIEVRVRKWY